MMKTLNHLSSIDFTKYYTIVFSIALLLLLMVVVGIVLYMDNEPEQKIAIPFGSGYNLVYGKTTDENNREKLDVVAIKMDITKVKLPREVWVQAFSPTNTETPPTRFSTKDRTIFYMVSHDQHGAGLTAVVDTTSPDSNILYRAPIVLNVNGLPRFGYLFRYASSFQYLPVKPDVLIKTEFTTEGRPMPCVANSPTKLTPARVNAFLIDVWGDRHSATSSGTR